MKEIFKWNSCFFILVFNDWASNNNFCHPIMCGLRSYENNHNDHGSIKVLCVLDLQTIYNNVAIIGGCSRKTVGYRSKGARYSNATVKNVPTAFQRVFKIINGSAVVNLHLNTNSLQHFYEKSQVCYSCYKQQRSHALKVAVNLEAKRCWYPIQNM